VVSGVVTAVSARTRIEVTLDHLACRLRSGGDCSRIHRYARMACMVPHVEPLATQAGFDNVRTREAPQSLRYVLAFKPPSAA
jgi:hypothetical protein